MRKIRICLRSLRVLVRNPLRFLLTVLSATLGVAGAVCSVNYTLGGRLKLLEQFDRLGASVLVVTPQQSRTAAGRARTGALVKTLVPADVAAIERGTTTVVRHSATFVQTALVKAGDLVRNNATVIGVEPAFFAIKHWRVTQGEELRADHDRRAARVALLGKSIARDLLGESAAGARILINRVPFTVVGVLAERGQGLDAANEDIQVYIPLSTAMHRLANAEYYSSLLLEISGESELDAAAGSVRSILLRRHRTLRLLGPDFDIRDQRQVVETRLAVSRRLYDYARWLGLGALLVSSLGSMAVTWIGVRERTNEIGVRRALGASRSDVLAQILFEALAPAALGCGLGAAAAWQGTLLSARFANQPAAFDSPTLRISLALSILLNAGFGLLPARAAARLDPTAALRFE